MESAGLRLPRWFQTAERILEEQREIEQGDEGQPVGRRLRDRTASLVGAHPVIVGSFLGIVVGRGRGPRAVGPGALAGGVLPAFPAKASGFFARARLRVPDHAARRDRSPRARPSARWARSSTLLLGSTSLAQKAMLAGRPAPRGRPDVPGRGPSDRSPRPVGGRGRRLRGLRDHALVLLPGPARPARGAGGAPRRRRAPRGGVRPRGAAGRSMAVRRRGRGHLRGADRLPAGGHAGDLGDRGGAAPHRAR